MYFRLNSKAKNGRYFPSYLKKVFSKVDTFEKDYTNISEAASGIKLIELKSLATLRVHSMSRT